jgi:uncharacterized protein YbbC (DUF1343 family)
MKIRWLLYLLLLPFCLTAAPTKIKLGVDVFFEEGHHLNLRGKTVGLVTNQSGVDQLLQPTSELFLQNQGDFTLVAFFAPEHGMNGSAYAFEKIEDSKHKANIPIYSLHGKTRRPTTEMLKGLDVIVYDMQDIGTRSYTFSTTLYYVMEEAAKKGIEVIVLDRPNPINGLIVDGPMLNDKWRSFVGYVNVPYCHGMTIGELAKFFNAEYNINCQLTVIPMKGWKRSMSFKDTGLSWVPPSPNIPEPDTPLFCASTGILGELSLVNIGVGYTMPFKVVGAPWIDAQKFADKLNAQKIPGVYFMPFYYRPFYGAYKSEECQGVKIIVTDMRSYRPLTVQYLLIGVLKSLYGKEIKARIAKVTPSQKSVFCKVNGNDEMFEWMQNEPYVAWKMIQYQKEQRKEFLNTRKKYLLY